MNRYMIVKEMVLLAALRAAIAALALVGRELGLSRGERQAVVERVRDALVAA